MQQRFAQIIHILTRVARFGAGLAFSVLIGAVLIQVIGRTFGRSPVWTEELTRFALLYLATFGAGLALKSGDLVNVDVVCEALPGRGPWRLRLISAVLTAGVCILLASHAVRFVAIGKFQTSPAMTLQMNYVHFSVLLMLALIAVFAVARIVGMLSGTDDGLPNKPQAED
ncbi:MAG: TRAP transporter small permease [Rhodobacteraceae bacterium]|nr:TRAP transporter small permease [Paracoccaceae bacterium]